MTINNTYRMLLLVMLDLSSTPIRTNDTLLGLLPPICFRRARAELPLASLASGAQRLWIHHS